jgi:ATP/maltotriose-dependent transcriptional regulator MalT
VGDPVRVFIADSSADERHRLRLRFGDDPRWRVVETAGAADVVVMSAAEFERLARPRAAGMPRERPIEGLTAREREVLVLVADGHSNREIGARLAISEHTVKFHLAAIFAKLGVATRAEAVQRGMRLGLIEI